MFVVDQMQVAQLAEVEQDTADLTIIICPTDQQATYYPQIYSTQFCPIAMRIRNVSFNLFS